MNDEWFGTLLLLTEVNERPGDGFPKNPPENLPAIFSALFVVLDCERRWGETLSTWSN